jgi:hypothetical protein
MHICSVASIFPTPKRPVTLFGFTLYTAWIFKMHKGGMHVWKKRMLTRLVVRRVPPGSPLS